MINIQLKVKHYYLIASILFEQAAYVSFSILEKIKKACEQKNEDDMTTVEIDVSSFISLFKTLSLKPEGSFNMINTEMLGILRPQIENGIQEGKEEWISLVTEIENIRNTNWEVCSQMINSGKQKLGI